MQALDVFGEKEDTMPEVTVHTPHTPSWVDLASPDVAAATRFYGQLFGWEAQQVTGPEMGNYTFFKLRGKDVAAVGARMTPEEPIAWHVYIASDNIDQTAEKVRAAGGSVLMGPDDVMDAARIGFFSDPTGAAFGVVQARAHKGMGLVQEPNAFTWAELRTRDIAAAKTFYQQVFGWGAQSTPIGPGQPEYTEWKMDGQSVGGAMPMMQPYFPEQVPPHWLLYFQVENTDRSAEQATQLGARVLADPMDFPGGRFAVISDPHGATFGILEARS
jgi:uncharacterized protein